MQDTQSNRVVCEEDMRTRASGENQIAWMGRDKKKKGEIEREG